LNEGPKDLPADDTPVEGTVPIYRLVKTTQCSVEAGQWEFQSGAFDNNEGDDMSVVLGNTLEAMGRLPDDLRRGCFRRRPTVGESLSCRRGPSRTRHRNSGVLRSRSNVRTETPKGRRDPHAAAV
jgi:hypothetical protein